VCSPVRCSCTRCFSCEAVSFGLRPWSLPAALAVAMPSGSGTDEVGFELSNHAEDVEQEPAHRAGGVVDRSPEVQGDTLLRQLIRDIGRVAQRTGETVKLRDGQDVTGTARRQCLAQPRSGSSRIRQPVVNMHVLIIDTQCCKTIALCCKILARRRNAGVSELGLRRTSCAQALSACPALPSA
jgi:hypothetical protein